MNGYNFEVQRCDPDLLNLNTCQCNQILPCIMGQQNFNGECVSQSTCKNVLLKDLSWHCLNDCPSEFGRSGNLCNNVFNGD